MGAPEAIILGGDARGMDKIIFDTQTPPDFGGIFDGDSFQEMEFRAWCNTATTYPKIKLRSSNKGNLIQRIKKLRVKNGIELSISHISGSTIELTFYGRKWNY
jgi:hypothetical protein